MKKFFISFILICSLFTTSSFGAEDAFEKGSKRFGGYISFYSTTGSSSSNVTVLSISPSFSFAVKDKLFLGANLNLEQIDYSSYYSNTNWSVGPLLEYYFVSREYSESDANLVPYLRLSFTRGKINDRDFTFRIINVGIMKMVSSHIGLDFGVVYSFDTVERYSYVYDPFFGYRGHLIEGDGQRLMIGVGIESFLF